MQKHRRPLSRIITALCLLGIFVLPASAYPAVTSDECEIVIVHTNDFHGNLLPLEERAFVPPPETVGGAAYLAAKIKELRKKFSSRVLLLDAGDIIQGTAVSNMFGGKPVIEYMNYMGYDAMSIGNHEFDWGLKGLKDIADEIHFPLLCANAVQSATGELLPGLKPYVILERGGTRIGIIGGVTPGTSRMTFPENIKGITFLDPRETVRKYVSELQQKNIRVIILLSHFGYGADKEIAQAVPGICAIIGGHNHIGIRATEKINDTLIVQAGSSGTFLGQLRLILDSHTGKILFYNIENELIPIVDSDIKPDPEVEKMIRPYAARIKPIMDEVIGRARADLTKDKWTGMADTKVGNFIADVVRERYAADIGIYNLGGIRTSLLKGDITKGDVYSMIPFDNHIITIELTGSQILDLLSSFADKHISIQVSGISFTYSPDKPKGEKISEITHNGSPIDSEKTYKLATLDFVYYTSDDRSSIRQGKNLTYGDMARDAIEEYVRKKVEIIPPEDERIRMAP